MSKKFSDLAKELNINEIMATNVDDVLFFAKKQNIKNLVLTESEMKLVIGWAIVNLSSAKDVLSSGIMKSFLGVKLVKKK